MSSPVREVKLCLLGDSLVGKSSIVHRFVFDTFNPAMDRTIGAAFFSKSVTVGDVSFRYQIWDTAGQEKYRALAPMYYRDAAAAIVVYDITDSESFMAVKMWMNELRRHTEPIVIAVVGNKCDLESARRVEKAEAVAFAANHGAMFLETSAKESFNISKLFSDIGDRLVLIDEKANAGNGSAPSTEGKIVVDASEPAAKKNLNCCQ